MDNVQGPSCLYSVASDYLCIDHSYNWRIHIQLSMFRVISNFNENEAQQ